MYYLITVYLSKFWTQIKKFAPWVGITAGQQITTYMHNAPTKLISDESGVRMLLHVITEGTTAAEKEAACGILRNVCGCVNPN